MTKRSTDELVLMTSSDRVVSFICNDNNNKIGRGSTHLNKFELRCERNGDDKTNTKEDDEEE